MKKYVALKDSLFGIKKDDVITHGKFTTPAGGGGRITSFSQTRVQLPSGTFVDGFDPSTEPLFFKEIVEVVGSFPIGSKVNVKEVMSATNVQAKFPFSDVSTMHNRSTIPAWTDLNVLGFREVGKKIFVIAQLGALTFRILQDKVKLAGNYYFVNSSGEIHPAQLGRNPKADLWRKGCNNYFNSKLEAQTYLDKVVNDSIGVLNWEQAK